MGEAKNREPGGRKFHMFLREQFLLVMHVLKKPSKDREERRKRAHMWEELGLRDAVRKVVELGPRTPAPGQAVGLDPYEWADDRTPIALRISGGVLDTMLAELNGQLQGEAEVYLGGLEDRLISVRDGSYSAPAGLFPDLASVPPEPAG